MVKNKKWSKTGAVFDTAEAHYEVLYRDGSHLDTIYTVK